MAEMERERVSLPHIPGFNDPETRRSIAHIPDPEAKVLLDGTETLVVLEYPEYLSHSDIDGIATALREQGITRYLILGNGATINALTEEDMRRLGWVRAPKVDEVEALAEKMHSAMGTYWHYADYGYYEEYADLPESLKDRLRDAVKAVFGTGTPKE